MNVLKKNQSKPLFWYNKHNLEALAFHMSHALNLAKYKSSNADM